jgi:glycosyltransferase involved in cell wall biosynthesis
MKNIKISVVIPCYNREKTILKCIESVLKQTKQVYEIIISDDCSTDNLKELISNIDDKVKYICLDKNSGAQAARNLGIKSTQGDWIAFLDSDDEWVPTKIAEQLKILEKYKYDPYVLVHTNALQIFDDKSIMMPMRKVSGKNVYIDVLNAPSPMFQGMLVSKQALIDIDYLDENVPSYQEWDTSIRLAKICRFEFIDEPMFLYNMQGADTISKNKIVEINGYQYILDKFRDEIIKHCGMEVMNHHLFVLITKCINYGFIYKAFTFLIGNRFKITIFTKIYIIMKIIYLFLIKKNIVIILKYIGLHSAIKKMIRPRALNND